MKYLTVSDLPTLVGLAKAAAQEKGADFYGWKNAPAVENDRLTHTIGWGESAETREVQVQEALDIYKSKLDGAYGERFLLTVGYIVAAVKAGRDVALLQKQKEQDVPFDATGWVIVSIGGYPMFHIAPHDLPLQDVADAGLINVVLEGSQDDKEHGWKGTNKVQEFNLLLDWALDA